MTTTFKNHPLNYNTEGSGNPIVLLHGFLESSEIWDAFAEEFSPQRQVIRLDLPGHGSSRPVAAEHSMELMAEALARVLEILEVEQADILGHSMGGYVALAFLEKYPGKVKNIVLLNSTTAADSQERKENRERAAGLVVKNKGAFVRMAISNLLTPGNNKKFSAETEVLKARALQFPTEGLTAALHGMKNRTDRTTVLAQFQGGKFLLAGEEDPLLNYKDIKDLAASSGCKLFSFPDGHLSYLENKEQFHQTVYFID